MAAELWQKIDAKLKRDISIIFANYDLNKLTNLEKRKIVFDYLTDHVTYNDALFKQIAAAKLNLIPRTKRNTPQELCDAIFKNIGICNSISQYYKLLLEELNIPVYYVVCTYIEDLSKHQDELEKLGSNLTGKISIGHGLNVIYDLDTKECSIDDLSFAIINKDKDNYFAYDINKAHFLKQGITDILPSKKWLIIDEAYIDMISGRRNNGSEVRQALKKNEAKVNLFLKENKVELDVNENSFIKENIKDEENNLIKGKVV